MKSFKTALMGAAFVSGTMGAATDTAAQDEAFLLAAAQNTGTARPTVEWKGRDCDRHRQSTEFKAEKTDAVSYQFFDGFQKRYLDKGVNPPPMVGVIVDRSTPEKKKKADLYVARVMEEVQKVAEQCLSPILVVPINYDKNLAKSLEDKRFLNQNYPRLPAANIYAENGIMIAVGSFYYAADNDSDGKIVPITIKGDENDDSALYFGVALRGHLSGNTPQNDRSRSVADEKNGKGSAAGDAAGKTGGGTSSASDVIMPVLGAG